MELEPVGWTQIIERLGQAGVRTVEVFGGDALLRKDVVYPMLYRCTALVIDTFFPTNGLLLDHEAAKNLVAAGLGRIYFSVDGIAALHDRIRGVNDGYKAAKDAIWNVYNARSNSHRHNPLIGVITTVSNMNVEHIEDLMGELERYPIDFAELQIAGEVGNEDIENSTVKGIKPTPFFVSTSGNSYLLSEEQVPILKETLRVLRSKKGKIPFNLNVSHVEPFTSETYCQGIFPPFACHWCTTVVTLTPSGDVVPCPMFTDFVLGNLGNQTSLDRIWGKQKHREFLAEQQNGNLPICRKCSMRHSYPGIREKFRQTFYQYID